ncbi:transposase [Wolbachia endosymbiont of Drosophila tsacasi]|nr:transposase [Wolbachia endosymbiont of Drosophila tsacasi]MDE5061929.1 transposase [Wolbachia endosymbiont of Drosophila tsacasi]MDE5062274.1 transposase [Wolbachia endosymbiont of Drosophila tsacasi]MDE5062563.1 transposase [Wolbachia endosymbiont of Drosophila tsacasi]
MKINDYRVNRDDVENIEIAMDSTVISIYSNSDQHNKDNVKTRKYNRADQVRKLHAALNIESKKVIAIKYTNSTLRDSILACSMLEEMDGKYGISSIRADASYDGRNVYKICKELNIKPIIRPIKNATVREKVDYLSERNNNVKVIQSYKNYEDGVKEWKMVMKYGLRSHIEGFFFRLKKTFGFSLKNKSEMNREKELLIKCYLINRFTEIGMPKFETAA